MCSCLACCRVNLEAPAQTRLLQISILGWYSCVTPGGPIALYSVTSSLVDDLGRRWLGVFVIAGCHLEAVLAPLRRYTLRGLLDDAMLNNMA